MVGGHTTTPAEPAERQDTMNTRKLNDEELTRLEAGENVVDLAVTCDGDSGYGPCGTYLDWTDGRCACGHEIEIEIADEDMTETRTAELDGGSIPPGRHIWRSSASTRCARDAATTVAPAGAPGSAK